MAKASNPPNRGGSGPKVTKQGKSGPIIGKMTSVTGHTAPWYPNKGSNKSGFTKGSNKPGGR